MIGRGRKVGLIERNGGSMKKHFPADTAQSGSDCLVDFERIGPRFRVVIATMSPSRIVVKWEPDAGRSRQQRIVMAAQPGKTILPAYSLLDDREARDLPGLETRLGADDLFARNANSGLDDRKGWRALAGQAGELTDFAEDRNDLELGRALPPNHADRYDLFRRTARADGDDLAVASSSRTGISVPAGVTVLVNAGTEAQRFPSPAAMSWSRMLPAETI